MFFKIGVSYPYLFLLTPLRSLQSQYSFFPLSIRMLLKGITSPGSFIPCCRLLEKVNCCSCCLFFVTLFSFCVFPSFFLPFFMTQPFPHNYLTPSFPIKDIFKNVIFVLVKKFAHRFIKFFKNIRFLYPSHTHTHTYTFSFVPFNSPSGTNMALIIGPFIPSLQLHFFSA